jgi:hypothetical protein
MPAPPDHSQPDVAIPLARQGRASVHDRLVDALSQALLAIDEAIDILGEENADELRWTEPHLKTVFQVVNSVMLQITD